MACRKPSVCKRIFKLIFSAKINSMREIKNVLICGVGAVGSIYAEKISNYDNNSLKVLVDSERLEKYTKNPKIFNGKELKLNYVLPSNNDFKADLIIIATKFDGLSDAVKNIKNFVKDDTIILSLLNGVTSEEIIAKTYGWHHTLLSYFIGHSAMRSGNIINHDGVGYITFGVKDKSLTDINDVKILQTYFDMIGVEYKNPNDMYRALWLKFLLNVGSNQSSAILNMTFGQMQKNNSYRSFLKKVMQEVVEIAIQEGVKNTESLIDEAFKSFDTMTPIGKTSMLQDVLSKRKTEVEMFAGTVIELGKKHNVQTPYNVIMKELIEIIQENYNLQS